MIGSPRFLADLIVVAGANQGQDETMASGVHVERMKLQMPRGLSDWRAVKELRVLLKQYDLVHMHGLWGPHVFAGGFAARRAGMPYMVSVHGMLTPWALNTSRWKKRLYWPIVDRRKLSAANCVRALTELEAGQIRAAGVRSPVCVVPNGVEPLCARTDGFYAAYPQFRNRRLVLFLGRVLSSKGVEILLHAWPKVSAGHEKAHLLIAGPAAEDYLGHLKALTAELHIAHSVEFLGQLNGCLKANTIAASEVFVLPSESEGLSNALLEALTLGLIAVISPECNFKQVESFGAGVVAQREASHFADALVSVLSLPPERADEMRSKAKLLAEQYSWAAAIEQLSEVYDWMLGGPFPVRTVII